MEKDFIISTDSGSDLTLEMCKEYSIECFKMDYTDNNNNIYKDTLLNKDRKKFYENMVNGTRYKTSAINYYDAYNYLIELLKINNNIIHISLASSVSSTYQNFLNARNDIVKENPNANIYILDSTLSSFGYGMLAIEASKRRKEGLSFNNICNYLEKMKYKVNTYYTTNTLNYLVDGGRVSKVACVFGTILSIKPILRLDYDGHLLVYKKAHGMKLTYKLMESLIGESVLDACEQTLYVMHCNSLNPEEIGNKCREDFNFKDVCYSYIGPIIGSHAGPGLIALFYFGKDRFK